MLACVGLAGCAGRTPLPALLAVDELTDVPFFAQTAYDCGPAALATILSASGVAVSPAELIDAVYIEGFRGSLQVELTAAARRYDRLPVPVPADVARMLDEVAAGRPVLVMQNLGTNRFPVWHYAVVVGFDADAGRVVLRSGTEPRRRERVQRFADSWARADRWGFVVAAPGEIPATATPERYMRALVGAERVLDPAGVARAYEAALARWPGATLVLFLAAARAQSAGRPAEAEDLYRRVIALAPRHAAARNNLAHLLNERGCREEALREARAAMDVSGAGGEFAAEIAATLSRIGGSGSAGAEPSACGTG